jgi:alpha-beta hydrolase superfamily lysophospholipase
LESGSYWFETRPGEERFAREWRPVGASLGAIVLIHGLSDHTGRFDHVGRFFAGKGFEVHGLDLKGNGMSPGKRGDFSSYEEVLDDIGFFLEKVRETRPELHCFLYGQSMGGNIVLNYGIRRKPAIAGIIASSPWLRLANPPGKIQEFIGGALRRINPALARPNGIDPADLSHDQAVAQSYSTDPLVHRLITLRTYACIKAAGQYALLHSGQLGCPTLVMHGTGDRITSQEASSEFFRNAPGGTTLRLWQGLRHELHNEPAREEVFGYMLKWMKDLLTQFPNLRTED